MAPAIKVQTLSGPQSHGKIACGGLKEAVTTRELQKATANAVTHFVNRDPMQPRPRDLRRAHAEPPAPAPPRPLVRYCRRSQSALGNGPPKFGGGGSIRALSPDTRTTPALSPSMPRYPGVGAMSSLRPAA